MLGLCKKKTRFNKHTPKLWWKMQKQTGSSFYSPQKDTLPQKAQLLTRFPCTAETPAWQMNKIIGFGLHYSFNLLKTSFSPLRSSDIRINTPSWIQCYAKNKLGLQGEMPLQRHVPRDHQSQHSLLICVSWAREHNPHYIPAEPRANTGKPEGTSWSMHWDGISLPTEKLESITQRRYVRTLYKQFTWFICQERRLPHHSLLQDTFLA